MTGSKRTALVLQNRDRHLLTELAVMRIVDRQTAEVIAGFSSIPRANSRLLALTRAGLLRRFFTGSIAHGRKAVYTLTSKGARLVDSPSAGIERSSGRLVVGDRFVEHQSVVNCVYVAVKYRPSPYPDLRLRRWLTFHRELTEAIKLKPDGYCECQRGDVVRGMFLEVDLGTEALSEWQRKTSRYLRLALSGDFERRFRQPQFRVLVVVNSEKRLANIRTTVAKSTDKIFWFTTADNIQRDGFWSPIWLRPTGDQRHSLL
jgi:hypothetical protein